MLRQTAFGIALSTLVLASGYMTAANPDNSSAKQTGRYQRSSLVTSQAKISNLGFQNTNLEKSVFNQTVSQNLKDVQL